MLRHLIALALIALPAPALAEPDSYPLLCGDKEPLSGEPSPVAPAQLVGTYRCSAEGLTITLTLSVDGRFVQRFDDASTPVEGEGSMSGTQQGRWRIADGQLLLFDKPTRAPTLTLVESHRDPAMWFRVEIVTPGGQPGDNLVVADDSDGTSVSGVYKGVVEVPRDYNWEPGRKYIMRGGDDLVLATLDVGRDGVNSFRYLYRPSDVEPFELKAFIAGAEGDRVAVPLGMSGALLRRVKP